MLQPTSPEAAGTVTLDGYRHLWQAVGLASVRPIKRDPGMFARLTARRLELACWIAALVLITLLAAGNASAIAGAESNSAASNASERLAVDAFLNSLMPSESSGWCIKEVIESVPRWPSSHDLTSAIDRQCFSRRQPARRHPRAPQASCVRTPGWRPSVPTVRVTGCLLP
ncbi:MAG TPA: hypothetical protein VM674_00400 [Candidatus Acidoferrum sp.]|nr:hypothetical protein [Candidatus Acidoferrum sp.]